LDFVGILSFVKIERLRSGHSKKKKGAKACDFCCETYLEIVNKTKKLEHGP